MQSEKKELDSFLCNAFAFDAARDSTAASCLSSGPYRLRILIDGSGLPTATKCAVELDEGKSFALLRTYQVELCREQVCIGGQHFEVSG
jgi:hypothetical protein